jgi:hypothetical protein
VAIAGAWAALLIFYRLLDKPTLQGTQRITATVGVEWGIFIALLLALAMLYVGRRIRASEHSQPPLSRERAARRPHAQGHDAESAETVATVATTPVPARARPAQDTEPRTASSAGRAAPRARPRFPPPPPGSPEQMSFEDSPSEEE